MSSPGRKDVEMSDDQDIVINSAGWMPMARELMAKKRSFFVEGWDFEFDSKQATAIAKEFGYDLMIQPDQRRALFSPRKSDQDRQTRPG